MGTLPKRGNIFLGEVPPISNVFFSPNLNQHATLNHGSAHVFFSAVPGLESCNTECGRYFEYSRIEMLTCHNDNICHLLWIISERK